MFHGLQRAGAYDILSNWLGHRCNRGWIWSDAIVVFPALLRSKDNRAYLPGGIDPRISRGWISEGLKLYLDL